MVQPGRVPRTAGRIVLAGAVVLVVVTLLAALGRATWIVAAALLPTAGALLAAGAWSASEARGDGDAALLARSVAPLVVTIAACVVLLALPGRLLDRANDELIAWTADDVVLVDRDLALTVEPAEGAPPAVPADPRSEPPPGVVIGRVPDDGRERWRTTLRPSAEHPFDEDDPDGWHRIGDVALVSGGGFGLAALDARTGRLLWQDTAVAPRVVLATTRTVATTRCAEPAPGADDDEPARCVAEARDLRTGDVRWSAPTRDEGRALGAPSSPPARDDGPWPSRWAVVDAPAADADGSAAGGGSSADGGSPAAGRSADRGGSSGAAGRSVGADRAPVGGRAWAIREIDTGRVLSRGRSGPGTTLTTLEGGILRGDPAELDGSTTATRLRLVAPERGVTSWTRTVEGSPVDAGASQAFSIAAPGHRVALKPTGGDVDAGLEPTSIERPSLSFVDPRSGRPVDVPVARDARRVTPVRAPTPWLTDAAVAAGPSPTRRLVAVDRDADLGMVLVPGSDEPPRTWPAGGAGASALTLVGPTIARRRVDDFADTTGEPVETGIELRDADTAEVVGRLRIDGPAGVRSEGDRIVVRREGGRGEDDEDLVLVRRP